MHFWFKKCHMMTIRTGVCVGKNVYYMGRTFTVYYIFSVIDVVVILLVKHSWHQLILQHWWLLLWIRNSLDIESRTKDLNFTLRRKEKVIKNYVDLMKGNWIIFKSFKSIHFLFLSPPHFAEERPYHFAALRLFVCRSVGLPRVYVHFLRRVCAYWKQIWYTDLSSKYLG